MTVRKSVYLIPVLAALMILMAASLSAVLPRPATITLLFVPIIVTLAWVAWAVMDRIVEGHKQTEAFVALCAVLPLRSVLPSTGNWAASADCLHLLAGIILTEKPQLMVEASSGVSTIVAGYCLQKNGSGHLISLEHDAQYFEQSRRLVAAHQLTDVVTVVHAPLEPHTINGKEWLWYRLNDLLPDAPIDLLFVDGPPQNTQTLARYPAVPLLAGKLAPNAMVVLDDGKRRDERTAAELWAQECQLSKQYVTLSKGAYILSKRPA
jgi:predicted O-methyltransferase YrrM